MSAPIRHGRHRRTSLWPTIYGALVGMVIGVWVFAMIWEAIR